MIRALLYPYSSCSITSVSPHQLPTNLPTYLELLHSLDIAFNGILGCTS